MTLPTPVVPVPLSDDGRGGVRVGKGLFPLEILIHEYGEGADPESIVHAYPALDLADVYAVIAYYLRHRAEVDAYVRRRDEAGAALQREIEVKQTGRGSLREKLLGRRA